MSSTNQEYSKTYLDNIELYKKENSKLTVADIQTFNINRGNYFAGTIAVCVIYGVFSLILLIITVFSPSGSQLVTETFRTFTVTFIIGMIIAVIMLTIAVVTYKPSVLETNPYDAQVCPDYWQLEQSSKDDTKDATDLNASLMQYKCVNNNALGKKTTQSYSNTDPEDKKALYTYTQKDTTKNYNENSTLDCTKVFPLLLNSVNNANEKINNVPNALACKYAEQCGVSWSAMCPNGAAFVP
jgi:hypothetical protein